MQSGKATYLLNYSFNFIHLFIYLFIHFEQYLARGPQFSEAGLDGALMKKKKTNKIKQKTKNNNR